MNSPQQLTTSENIWHNKRVMVLGAAGFASSHLCAELLGRQAQLWAFDRVTRFEAPVGSSASTWGEPNWIAGDLRDAELLKMIVARYEPEWVFLVAAQPIVGIANALPLETAHINIMGAYNALEACRLSKRSHKLVFASSGAVYGATNTTQAIDEEHAFLPAANIYAPTKAAADLAVRSYAKTYGLPTATCRWMNTYGPGDGNLSRIVPATIARLMRGERALIDGTDGTNILEMLHVRDMTRGYLAVAERLEDADVRGHAFNFGGGVPISLLDAVRQIILAWNAVSGENVEVEPLITGPKIQSVKYLSIEKARRVLGWQPQIELQAGLRETVQWYLDHPETLGVSRD